MTAAPNPRLAVRGVTARPVLPIERPVVARIATVTEWPIVLVDLDTEEGSGGARGAGACGRNRGGAILKGRFRAPSTRIPMFLRKESLR